MSFSVNRPLRTVHKLILTVIFFKVEHFETN